MTTTSILRNDGIIIRTNLEGARTGPLQGLKFVAKDVFDVKGFSTGAGNPDWARTHPIASENARVVDALLNAGASLIGKTISDEIAYSVDGINAHFGAPTNPQYPDRTTGGSSSGTASAVGSKLADFGIGTDTAGSVRIPASFCGLYGFRPTHGRVDTGGVVPLAPLFDTVGWMSRNAEILARCGQVLLDEKARLRDGLHARKLLIATDAFQSCTPEFRQALAQAIAKTSALFTEAEEISLSDWGWGDYFEHFRYVQSWHAWRCHRDWVTSVKPLFDPSIQSRFDFASQVSEDDCLQHERERQKLIAHCDRMLIPGVVLCLPTTADLPPSISATAEVLLENRVRNISLTALASLAELPQVTMPVSFAPGLSTGFSLVGGKDSDSWLLDLCVKLA